MNIYSCGKVLHVHLLCINCRHDSEVMARSNPGADSQGSATPGLPLSRKHRLSDSSEPEATPIASLSLRQRTVSKRVKQELLEEEEGRGEGGSAAEEGDRPRG